jgi:glycosyltransferase involved in cell wall biosynthesis
MQAIAWDLLVQFAAQGYRVTVLTTEIEGRPEPFESQGVLVVPIVGASSEKYSRAWWVGTRRYVEAQSPLTYQGFLSISAAGAGLLPLKKRLGIPFVFQAHGTSWGEIESKFRSGKFIQWLKSVKNFYWLFKDFTIYQRFDHLALVGDVLSKQFASWPVSWLSKGVPRSVIRNGVDGSIFKPDKILRDEVRERYRWDSLETVYVFAARLHPQKGARQTIEAFAKVSSSFPSKLLIIGGGEEEASLRSLVAAKGLDTKVTFTGAMKREDIPAMLAAADIFVFPTQRKEGLPMNVLEALACGLPVVVSETAQDVFDSNLTLNYCNSSDTDDIAATMLKVAQSRDVRRSLLTPSYQLKACAEQYLALFGVEAS